MAEEYVTNEVCELRGKIYTSKLEALECEISTVKEHQAGLREDIKEVRDLQKQILYAIIGLFGASVLTLIGVITGRAIDFRVFFP
jgi:hypothetical protein